jgi:spore germination protein KC
MKKKKMLLYIVVIGVLILSLTGNWSRKEPKHLAVGTSYLYDIDENGDIVITVEYLNVPAGGISTTGNEKFILMKHKGKTAPKAVRDPELVVEKDFFGSHNKVRFFSEKMVKRGVYDIFDFFARGYITDERPYLIVVKNGDPGIIYKSDKNFSDRLGDVVVEMAEFRGDKTLNGVFIRTMEFMRDYYTEGKQCVMGVVEIRPNPISLDEANEEDKPWKNYASFEGLAVFKGDKLVGYLSKDDTLSYRYIAQKVEDATLEFNVEGAILTAIARRTNVKVDVEMKDGKPEFEVTVHNKLMVAQNNTKYDVSDKDDIKILEELICEDLAKRISDSIKTVQTEYKSDIYGFGQQLHIKHPYEWKKFRDNWDDEHFPEVKVNVVVKTCIDFDGQIMEKFGQRNVKQRKY